MHRSIIGLMALVTASASAQTVFFDDFQGNDLLPHWGQPPAQDWEYNVADGRLTVTNLFYPSNPHIPSNIAAMSAEFPPLMDFQMDAWMGWELGQQPHRLLLKVLGPWQNPIIAQLRYFHHVSQGPLPTVTASASNQAVTDLAPSPGTHHFTIRRKGTQFDFLLNGHPFASLTDAFGTPAGGIGFEFLGPYPGEFAPMHIERVRVVPAPATFAIALGFGLICIARRRR